jgi:DedD protein
MDELLLKRIVGIVVLLLCALLLSWLLPRPGLVGPSEDGTRLMTVDLRNPDSQAVEVPEPGVLAETESPARGAEPIDTEAALAGGPPDPEIAAAPEEAESSAPTVESEPTPSAVPKPPVSAAPKASIPAESVKPAPPKAAPAPKPAAKPPVAASKPEPKPKPEVAASAPKPTPPPAATGGSWYVQVGAYAQLERAEEVRGRIKAAGVSSMVAPTETAKGTLYRVRCGPYPRAQADAIRERLVRAQLPANVVAK